MASPMVVAGQIFYRMSLDRKGRVCVYVFEGGCDGNECEQAFAQLAKELA
jgi:hypothetical protein